MKVICEIDVSENAHGEVLVVSNIVSKQNGFINLQFNGVSCSVKPEELIAAIERTRSDSE